MRIIVPILLIAIFILSALILTTCGDDPPNGPDPKPTGLIAINGLYFKGHMGDSTYHKTPEFAVADDAGKYIPNKQIQLELIAGDGTLAPKSIITDSTGIATIPYKFSGSLGHAIIRLTVPGTDTLDIYLRAEVLIPGEHGQGQYVLFDDILEDVKNFNGQPERIDIDPYVWQNYAVYENSLGVVVVIQDTNQDSLANNNEDVTTVIVNTVFEGKTLTTPPIGIGSTIDSLRAAFGVPDSIIYDPTPPPAYMIWLNGDIYWGGTDTDTTIFEIHLRDHSPVSTTMRKDDLEIQQSYSTKRFMNNIH
jgi:hypothetical protein